VIDFVVGGTIGDGEVEAWAVLFGSVGSVGFEYRSAATAPGSMSGVVLGIAVAACAEVGV
jgi:hypothetical protein